MLAALGGPEAMRRVFGAVLTDNGAEFADEAAVAALFGERPGETRLFYCDPRQSQQKGACERNHVEIRKILPKGAGIGLGLLTGTDAALIMSHVNSEPHGALAWGRPVDALLAAFSDDARALMDAPGVEGIALGDLDLTPRLVESARAERGEPPLAGRAPETCALGGAVALSPDRLRGGRAEHAPDSAQRPSPQPLRLRGRLPDPLRGAWGALRWLRESSRSPKCCAKVENQPTAKTPRKHDRSCLFFQLRSTVFAKRTQPKTRDRESFFFTRLTLEIISDQ